MNTKKELILFMPFIGGGGVEKNLLLSVIIYLKNLKRLLFVQAQLTKKRNLIIK